MTDKELQNILDLGENYRLKIKALIERKNSFAVGSMAHFAAIHDVNKWSSLYKEWKTVYAETLLLELRKLKGLDNAQTPKPEIA